jgi:hypothetical protein
VPYYGKAHAAGYDPRPRGSIAARRELPKHNKRLGEWKPDLPADLDTHMTDPS